MPKVALSNGLELTSEEIQRAEYYPPHSLDSYGCHFGGAEMRACPYLFIQTAESAERIGGAEAEKDAELLERVGVKVVRHATARASVKTTS